MSRINGWNNAVGRLSSLIHKWWMAFSLVCGMALILSFKEEFALQAVSLLAVSSARAKGRWWPQHRGVLPVSGAGAVVLSPCVMLRAALSPLGHCVPPLFFCWRRYFPLRWERWDKLKLVSALLKTLRYYQSGLIWSQHPGRYSTKNFY